MRFTGSAIRDEAAALRLSGSLRLIPGVTLVRINHLASSLVVHFEGGEATRGAIMRHLGIGAGQPAARPFPSDVAARAVADALLREVIGHLAGRTLAMMVAAVL